VIASELGGAQTDPESANSLVSEAERERFAAIVRD